MVSDRALKYVHDARPVSMVVNRAEDPSRLDGHHTHSKLAPYHAFDFGAKVKGYKVLHRDASRLGCLLFGCHSGVPSVDRSRLADGRKSRWSGYQQCLALVTSRKVVS